MCGIAGIVWRDPERPAAVDGVNSMTDILAHRGPDGKGYYTRKSVALGHRRLAILDLSEAGHQPMVSSDGRFVIVYNGEIYNYLELRDELRQGGWTPRSDSDTEVMLEAYRVWGAGCVERFNGMWACAIYDTLREEVFFSRDRFGIKPLYYLLRSDCFVFASEMKAILAAFPEERIPNLSTIHRYLPSGALDEGTETFFEKIASLPAAYNAVYQLGSGRFRTWKYWDVDIQAFRGKWLTGDPVDVMWELLNSAVRLHMRSDVPVGSCLSGGIDSSTIVCLMSRLRSEPVHTFSALYQDRDCDESHYIDSVNAHAHTIPHPVHPQPMGELVEDLRKIVWHQDEPPAGPGLYSQYHVMKRACKDVKVILDGQGGDELFAGYIPYFLPYLTDLWHRGGLTNRLKALRVAPEVALRWGFKMLFQRIGNLKTIPTAGADVLARLFPGRKQRRSNPPFFHDSLLKQVNGKRIERDFPRKLPDRLADSLYWDLVQRSIPQLLHYEDRNSMAFSIEARVPLLDYRIVEFALALDSCYKIKGTWTKWILRKAASRVLPQTVAWRRSKMGYPTPFARWLREKPTGSLIESLILSPSFLRREIVSEKTVRFYWDLHQSGADCSWLLFRYATLEIWFRLYIDSFEPTPAQRNSYPSPDASEAHACPTARP